MYKILYIGGKKLGKEAKKILKRYSKNFIVHTKLNANEQYDYLFNLFGDKIFKEKTLNQIKFGAINFHYGKLPLYRGRFIVSHILNNDEKETCVTCHFIDKGIDTGDIIFEKQIKVSKFDDAHTLYKKCTKESVFLFEKTLQYIINHKKLPRKKQRGQGHYYPNKPLNHDEVNLSLPIRKIKNFIRATSFPPYFPYIKIHGIKYYVIREDYKI